MSVAYDISSKADILLEKLGEESSNFYEVYLKLGSNESLSCFMTDKEKSDLEHNFFMGNPLSIIILDETLKQLYTIQVNTKYIQFIKTQKVRFTYAL